MGHRAKCPKIPIWNAGKHWTPKLRSVGDRISNLTRKNKHSSMKIKCKMPFKRSEYFNWILYYRIESLSRFDINSYKPPQATFPAMCQSIKCRTPRRDGELHHWRISFFWWLHWSKYINIVKLQAIIALVRHSKELHVAEVINCFHSFLLLQASIGLGW